MSNNNEYEYKNDMNNKQKKTKGFDDDGRTVADMKDIDGASPNWFGLLNLENRLSRKKTRALKEINTDINKPQLLPLTKKERRAMVKAAWLIGLKTAIIGTAILAGLFLIMHVIVYFWNS